MLFFSDFIFNIRDGLEIAQKKGEKCEYSFF